MLSHGAVLVVIGSGSLVPFQISPFSNAQVFSSSMPNQSNRSHYNSYFPFVISLVLTFGKAAPITSRTQPVVV